MPSRQLSSSAAIERDGDLHRHVQLRCQSRRFRLSMWYVLVLAVEEGWTRGSGLFDFDLGLVVVVMPSISWDRGEVVRMVLCCFS